MAAKTFYATGDMKDPTYRTRMLKAGDPVQLDGPLARLYAALGKVTDKKPRAAKAEAPAEAPAKAPRKRRAKKPA